MTVSVTSCVSGAAIRATTARAPRRDQHALTAPITAHLVAVAIDQRVEPVLRRHRVAHRRRAQRDADDAPAQSPAEIVEYDRLMRAVEGAEAEMDDAAAQRARS